MKKNFGLILASMLSTAVMAQAPATPPAPPTTAPSTPTATPADSTTLVTPAPLPPETTTTNKPPAKVKKPKKKTVKKKEADKAAMPEAAPADPVVANEPAVAKQNNVNVRGQSHINSEVVGHLQKGDQVTVLEVITLKHPKTDEPANWAKIAMPASLHAWVNTSFIDATNQVVSARKLNLRSGPGENYSVIGTLVKGDAVKPVTTKGDWTQVEPPTNAFAYVAAHLLVHKAPEPTAPPPPVAVTPTPTIVQNPGAIAPPPTEPPTTGQPLPQPTVLPAIPAPLPPPVEEQPLPKRIVEREGLVGDSVSIQAPSHYELKNLENGRVMDYLYSSSDNLKLVRYRGLTVVVIGEEELDERWPNTPVLTIQKIQVVK